MRFQLYLSHSWTAIGFVSGKKLINWISLGYFTDLEMTL